MTIARLSQTAALVTVFGATGAQADLTAALVWEDMSDLITSFGYQMEADQDFDADGLTLTNMTITSLPFDPDAEAVTIDFGTVRMTENADGSVSIEWPETVPLSIRGTGADDIPFEVEFLIDQTAASQLVSGTPDTLTYDYAAETIDVRLVDVTENGATLSEDVVSVSLGLAAVSGTTVSRPGDVHLYERTASADSVVYALSFADPEEGGAFSLAGRNDDIRIESSGELPQGLDLENLDPEFFLNTAAAGLMSHGGGAMELDLVDEDGQTVAVESRSSGAAVDVLLGPDGINYDFTFLDSNVLMSVPDLPFPISFSMASSGGLFQLPLRASDDPQPFGFGLALRDVVVSDSVWNLFDPGALLPRDPADMVLNLSGTATLLTDFFETEMTSPEDDLDLDLNTLDINELVLSLAGARLTGDGAFVFDPDKPSPFGNFPSPVGKLNIALSGANGLLDTLVAMGFVPEDQAMGARMMMGLLAIPGTEPDTMTSMIELNDQGHVLANGQRIQ